jgi:hypothetical protein
MIAWIWALVPTSTPAVGWSTMSLRDLRALPYGGAESPDRRLKRDAVGQADRFEQRPRGLAYRRAAEREPVRLGAEHDVLCHAQLGHQAELLVDNGDAVPAASLGLPSVTGSPSISTEPP